MSEIQKKKPSVISDVRYACAVGATNTVVAIKGAVPIENCSPRLPVEDDSNVDL